MNLALISIAQKALQNKHTTGAAIVYAASKFGCPLLAVWWPSHKAQCETTAGLLEGAAVFYGFAAAGDGGKSSTETKQHLNELQAQINEVKGDSSHIVKPEPPKA